MNKTLITLAVLAAVGAASGAVLLYAGAINVAADALMTMTLTGVAGGLVIAVADDVDPAA